MSLANQTAFGNLDLGDVLSAVGLGNIGIEFNKFVDDLIEEIFGEPGRDGVPGLDTHPMAALNYMHNKNRAIVEAAQQRPMVRLADKNLDILTELREEMTCEYEELAADTAQARYIVRYENWIVDHIINQVRIDEDLHILIDPIPTERNWRTRWGGKVKTINVQRHEDGTSTVEIIAFSMREHAKYLLLAANPFLMPEVQLPRMWVLPGPIRTILFMSFFINLARLFVPGLATITNAFNPFSWINPLNATGFENLNPLSWPIQVAFVNAGLDSSRWSVLGAQWTNWHDATAEMLMDAGCIMRFYTWLEEDADSPHDELEDIVKTLPLVGEDVAQLTRPTRNCVVARIEDWAGSEGPTGTPIDGLLETVGVTLDDLFSSIILDPNTGQTIDGETYYDVDNETPLFQGLLGVKPEPPKVIWRDGQFTGMVSSSHVLTKGPPRTLMTGGRSPAIVNELQTFGIKYGLSQLSDMLNAAIGTFVNTAWEMPATPGLEELYQGQLDNSLFAWERITDPLRAIWSGDLAFQEYFERGHGVAYTLAGFLTLREARYKTRAFHGFQCVIRNAMPWIVDKDIRLGQRGGWEFDQIIYVDQLMGIKRGWERQKPVLSTLSIGDNMDYQDAFARGMRALQAVYSTVGNFLGEGTVFA